LSFGVFMGCGGALLLQGVALASENPSYVIAHADGGY
jgi:hypothetical protein